MLKVVMSRLTLGNTVPHCLAPPSGGHDAHGSVRHWLRQLVIIFVCFGATMKIQIGGGRVR